MTLNDEVFADIGMSDDGVAGAGGVDRDAAPQRRRLLASPRPKSPMPVRRLVIRRDGSGIVAVTAVPEPGRDRMLSRPPTISARSAIDSSP